MAETLTNFDWSTAPKGNSRGRLPKDTWLNGQVWKLTRGDDFQGKAAGVLANLRKKAKGEGKVVKAVIEGSEDTGITMTLQAFLDGGLPIPAADASDTTAAPADEATAAV